MAKRIHDLKGRKFGNLLALKEVSPYIHIKSGRKERQWFCVCSCLNSVIVRQRNLLSGKTKSCGCLMFKSSSK
jgi:hypothetical protein